MSDLVTRQAAGIDMAELGERIRLERLRRHLSLDDLAARAEVSRSMLSAVERGGKVPTVVTLHRIAIGLGTTITRLLGEEQTARVILLRRDEQDVARDPTGWERRHLSPVLPGVDFEFMRTTLPPGVDAGTFGPHPTGSREYVAVEQGTLQLTIDGTPRTLNAGDSIFYAGDCRHSFANSGDQPCVYYLVLDAPVTGSHALGRGA